MIRDTYNDWSSPYSERFLEKIDGVSALVFAHLTDSGRLEDTNSHPAPNSLISTLKSRLFVSGLLEKGGSTRTLLAVDPDHATPAELDTTQLKKRSFHTVIRNMLDQYEHNSKSKAEIRRHAEDQLINFIYETFQNTIEHGRYTSDNDLISGIRYLRLHVYLGNSILNLVRRAKGFPQLETFLNRQQHSRRPMRFIELAVSDVGQGITSHYLHSKAENSLPMCERAEVLQQLVCGRLSSKSYMSGVGLGLPNAVSALRELKAFLSLRTEEFWLFQDYADQQHSEDPTLFLQSVGKRSSIAPLVGTQFNVLIEYQM